MSWVWALAAGAAVAAAKSDKKTPAFSAGTPTASTIGARPQTYGAVDAPGWLGVLIAHGLLVQAKIADYMLEHTHISWDLKLRDGTSGTVEHPASRFAFSHCEFPPPVTIKQGFLNNQGAGNIVWPIWNNASYQEYLEERRPISEAYAHFCEHYLEAKDRYKGCQFDLGLTSPHRGRIMQNRKTGGSGTFTAAKGVTSLEQFSEVDAEYRDRWLRYYLCARWIVWAAEMMRIHSGLAIKPNTPKGWPEYCTSWAIGCADIWRLLNRKRLDFGDTKNGQIDQAYTSRVLQHVMRDIPRPGELASGAELVRPRRLADWAPLADRLAPGYHWPSGAWGDTIKAKAKKAVWDSLGMRICRTLSGVASSLASTGLSIGAGALGAAVGGVLGHMLERGLSALFTALSPVFFGGTPTGPDFAALAKGIAGGAAVGGYTLDEAVNAWKRQVADIASADQWEWAHALTDGLLPENLKQADALGKEIGL